MEQHSKSKKFYETVKDDFKSQNLRDQYRKELTEVKEFYFTEDRKKRFQQFGKLKRAFFVVIWSIEAMFYKLSFFRRILLFLGIILIIIDGTVIFEFGESVRTSNTGTALLGGLLLIFLLLLEIKDKLFVRSEIDIAKKVQASLLPKEKHHIEDWKIWLYSKPANDVGGDLIDIQKVSENRVDISLGDVSGKGLGAALLMSKLQATLRALATESGSIAELLNRVNRIIKEDTPANSFSSLIHLSLDTNGNEITYVNAGQTRPLILDNQRVTLLEKGELALGLTGKHEFSEKKLTLESNQYLILYSDGVTEAVNENDEFFDLEGIITELEKYSDISASELGNNLIKAIDSFTGDAKLHDDITIAVVTRETSNGKAK